MNAPQCECIGTQVAIAAGSGLQMLTIEQALLLDVKLGKAIKEAFHNRAENARWQADLIAREKS